MTIILEAYTKATVNYTWSHFNLLHMESAKFKFSHIHYEDCENPKGLEFSCLKASFQMERRIGYYVIKYVATHYTCHF